jgi:DNA polymerase III alpha subunit (gram-positive type)
MAKAHMADVDNDNVYRMLQLSPELSQALDSTAGNKYRVIFDIETTGTLEDKNSRIFQLAAKVVDAKGNVVENLNYIINPEKHMPVRAVLN